MKDSDKPSGMLWTFFPIHKSEYKKFIPLALLMFCILFNYTILRDTKDALINTAKGAGPEAIPYIKGIFVVLSAITFVILYSKLANIFSPQKLFYSITAVFLIFFFFFSFVLYPNVEYLHPSMERVRRLQEEMPNLKFLISVWAVWTYTIFYLFAELWGSVVISLLFWQFASDVVKSDEAKRFYPLFGIMSNFALILSGWSIKQFAALGLKSPTDPWGLSLKYLASAITLFGILMMIFYRISNMNISKEEKEEKLKKSKPKLSMKDSIRYLLKSPYLGLIAILVFSYGFSINIIEIVWKKQLAIRYAGDQCGYVAFMGGFSQYTGLSVVLLIILTKGIINKFGWLVGAIITPLMLFITGVFFVSFVLFSETQVVNEMLMGFGTSSIIAASYIGAVQNIMAKGFKYSLFDPTKEMAYIPLDQELKTKGKAAVDVIGARLGKAAGSYIWMSLFAIVGGDIMLAAPYAIFLVAIVVGIWIFSVTKLSKLHTNLLKKQEKDTEQ